MSARELVAGYAARSLSPVEVTRATLERIDALNPRINAYCLVDHESAWAAARASEARWMQGRPLGRLDGVPTSIKDLILTRGWPTLRGSRTIDPDQAWEDDAPATARLREAGAVLLGKTTTPEFGWRASTDSALTGITRNPWNTDLTPGGSSGGAAASVAAGMGALAVGTDGGGSIRIPAAFTGTVGIKPQFGRVPAWPASPMGTVAHLGPHARTVADAAAMLDVLARPDPRDGWSLPPTDHEFALDAFAPGSEAAPNLRGLRIAYSPTLGHVDCLAPEIAAALDAAARTFEALGAIVEARDPGFPDCHDTFMVHWMASARVMVQKIPEEKRRLLDPGLLAATDAAARYTLADFLDAQDQRLRIAIAMRRLALTHDLLLTPATAVLPFETGLVAPAAEGRTRRAVAAFDWTWWTPYSTPFNLSQQPAIVLPCGRSASGLPISLQLVARHHDEASCIAAAAAYQAATHWHCDAPPC
jgi:aspartyl-tRNA(Asn)/glutamyl-tRNA(Gln) amidotransferase subunit A